METKYLKINPADNVVVAISDLKAGEAITVDGHAITCLLYTSPSPRDYAASRMPSSA